MTKYSAILWALVVCFQICRGDSLVTSQADGRCPGGTPVNFEKCIAILNTTGRLQTQEDAETTCTSWSQTAGLLTIKTQQEQDFVTEFLFHTNNVMDDVWLGLKQAENGSKKFEWRDGVELEFTNWANQTTPDEDHRCAQLTSGKGFHAAGLWVKVDCRKRMVVVCEKPLTLTLGLLDEMISDQKVSVKKETQDLQAKIRSLEQSNVAAQNKIAELAEENRELVKVISSTQEHLHEEMSNLTKSTPSIPTGFIYIQLPNQDPPTILWPQREWTEVTNQYAGLFFRVLGGTSAPFGQTQEANNSRLEQVSTGFNGLMDGTTKVPSNGTWSGYVYTGHSSGEESFISLRFRLSNGEVRPRNQAVRIWQCAD